MIDEQTRGDPESPLRWTCQSTRAIADALTRRKHPVSHTKVAQILHRLAYSLQGNRKTEEGEDHPDRDAQFRHINNAVKQYLKWGWPVISVDTKKKELIGNYLDRAERSRFCHIVAGVYSPRSPKFSRTRTLGASVRVVFRLRPFLWRSRRQRLCPGRRSGANPLGRVVGMSDT